MRKSSKDCRADRARVNSRLQAEADSTITTGYDRKCNRSSIFVYMPVSGFEAQEASCKEEGAA